MAHMPALAPSLCLSGESDVSVSGSFIEAASLLLAAHTVCALVQVELVYASRQGKRCWTLPRVYCLVSRLPCLPALFNLLLAVLHQVSALAPRTDLFHTSLALEWIYFTALAPSMDLTSCSRSCIR